MIKRSATSQPKPPAGIDGRCGEPQDSDPYPRTPAMAAGVADRVWRIEEIVALLG